LFLQTATTKWNGRDRFNLKFVNIGGVLVLERSRDISVFKQTILQKLQKCQTHYTELHVSPFRDATVNDAVHISAVSAEVIQMAEAGLDKSGDRFDTGYSPWS
jgi:hypothetical protein